VNRIYTTLLTAMVLTALSTGCGPFSSVTIGKSGKRPPTGVDTSRGASGPPPHAPAHGYRHKQRDSHGQDVELVFDSGLGVYVVVGMQGVYYWDGAFIRVDGDQWYASFSLDDGWEPQRVSDLPPGLQTKQYRVGKKGKKPKAHPAKGRW